MVGFDSRFAARVASRRIMAHGDGTRDGDPVFIYLLSVPSTLRIPPCAQRTRQNTHTYALKPYNPPSSPHNRHIPDCRHSRTTLSLRPYLSLSRCQSHQGSHRGRIVRRRMGQIIHACTAPSCRCAIALPVAAVAVTAAPPWGHCAPGMQHLPCRARVATPVRAPRPLAG